MDKEDVRSALSELVTDDPGNLIPGCNTAIFDLPLVGMAAALDPMFSLLQERDVVGPDHMPPTSWLPEAETVISYFLPITSEVCSSNVGGAEPSRQWIFARFYGEELNNRLKRLLVARLESAGHRAVAPTLDPRFQTRDLNANWSERHVAYVAGLGTFGLNAGLITRRGVAGRFGSVVTSLRLEPSSRPYTTHTAYCPFLAGDGCGSCLERCPAGALTATGKDRNLCSEHLGSVVGPSVRHRYGFPYSPCGKCQVGLPCSGVIPPDHAG